MTHWNKYAYNKKPTKGGKGNKWQQQEKTSQFGFKNRKPRGKKETR